MSENSALEEAIRKAVTATLKSLTPEQLRELTMEPYESGPVSLSERWQGMSSDERAQAEQEIWAAKARENSGDLRDADDEELAHTEVPDISSLPRDPEYPRDFVQSVILSSAAPTQEQRLAIVQFLVGEGIETIMFTTAEPKTWDSPPTEEGITAEYGTLAVPVIEEEKNDDTAAIDD